MRSCSRESFRAIVGLFLSGGELSPMGSCLINIGIVVLVGNSWVLFYPVGNFPQWGVVL